MMAMSRYLRFVALCLFLAPVLDIGPAAAAVIQVGVDSYRVNGAPPTTAAWEVAERLAVAKDVAIVVMDPKATKATVQTLMQNLETLKVPTLFTKKVDYEVLVKRGIVKPNTAP
jgi:hypothetical protein